MLLRPAPREGKEGQKDQNRGRGKKSKREEEGPKTDYRACSIDLPRGGKDKDACKNTKNRRKKKFN